MLRILLPFSPLSLLHSFFLSPSLFKVLTVIQFTFMYILYAITHNQGRDQGGGSRGGEGALHHYTTFQFTTHAVSASKDGHKLNPSRK